MAPSSSWMRSKFRNADGSHSQAATQLLSELRASRPPSEYGTILGAFRASAQQTARTLFSSGLKKPSELIWAKTALIPLPLKSEFLWSEHWLKPHAARINAFRRAASELQKLVLANRLADAKDKLDATVRTSGWTLWAVELRAALLQLADGTQAQRAWLGELQATAVNSIPGLLFQILEDRNDDAFSYDAVYGKCNNSFPRLESITPWLVDYLKYRALSLVETPRRALPNILCRDISSSLVDYYESIIEAIGYVACDPDLCDLIPTAHRLVKSLISAGYQDHRLNKLLLGLDDAEAIPTEILAQPNELYQELYGHVSGETSTLPLTIAGDLARCRTEGAAAYETVGKLMKWGLNLRGLDIGPAVANSALYASSGVASERVLGFSVITLPDSVCVQDAAALGSDTARRLVLAYLASVGKQTAPDQLIALSRWGFYEVFPEPGPLHLWFAQRLLEAQKYEELRALLQSLRDRGPYWERQCAKFDALVLIKEGQCESVVQLLEAWFRKDYRYAIEFPSDTLFSAWKWMHFKDLDPIQVGLVAHYEFLARGATSVGYICKMACRRFLQSGMRESVADDFAVADNDRKEQLIAFLRDVWVEENLSMCHQFESTAEVRVERMAVLQLLLGWDQDSQAEYAEGIKDLTLDQTLQRGLERIDETRVFVNESAITRWAEKELGQDYERWRRLSESTSGGRSVDDLLRRFALDPDNIDVLKEFSEGKPTAADTLLIDVVDRFYKRFLLDPTDGLDTYLSVRIRHGSLRGTILGPLEEQGLLYSATGFSQEAFENRWGDTLRLSKDEKEVVLSAMQAFSTDIRSLVDNFVDQRVQVRSPDKPNGAFTQVVSPPLAKLLAAGLAERPPSFQAFLNSGYFIFWKLIEYGVADLRAYVNEDLSNALHGRVELLKQTLRSMGQKYLPLITTLTTASTMTKSQCDTVANWFRLPSAGSGEYYQLADAIEIASVATRNVHRRFPANVQLKSLPPKPLPLTTSALAVLMDCLFVIFENAWKHSGLSVDLPPIELYCEFDANHRLLTFESHSALSDDRMKALISGGLSVLRAKYIGELPLELINREGGSGFPKLARLTRSVPRELCEQPFDFGIKEGQWFTRLTVPLYEREGVFEAYE